VFKLREIESKTSKRFEASAPSYVKLPDVWTNSKPLERFYVAPKQPNFLHPLRKMEFEIVRVSRFVPPKVDHPEVVHFGQTGVLAVIIND
jgi:hypothetical protein